MNLRYRVEVSQAERDELKALISAGKIPYANSSLLAADAGASDEDIAISVGVGGSTVYRTKRRFVLGNLERGAAPRRAAQALGQRGSLAGGDGLFKPAAGPRPLDPGFAGR